MICCKGTTPCTLWNVLQRRSASDEKEEKKRKGRYSIFPNFNIPFLIAIAFILF